MIERKCRRPAFVLCWFQKSEGFSGDLPKGAVPNDALAAPATNARDQISMRGYASPVRTLGGRDSLAGHGQLESATEQRSVRERMALRAMAMTD